MLTLLAVFGILLLIIILALFTTSFVMIVEFVVPVMVAIWIASLCYKLIRKWFSTKKKEEES